MPTKQYKMERWYRHPLIKACVPCRWIRHARSINACSQMSSYLNHCKRTLFDMNRSYSLRRQLPKTHLFWEDSSTIQHPPKASAICLWEAIEEPIVICVVPPPPFTLENYTSMFLLKSAKLLWSTHLHILMLCLIIEEEKIVCQKPLSAQEHSWLSSWLGDKLL